MSEKQKKKTMASLMPGFNLEDLFNQVQEQTEHTTGQLPLDGVIHVLQTSKTRRATYVAKTMGVDIANLRGAIALLTGITLSDMVLQWRLLQANRLLTTTDQSVTAIARQCGYRNSISLILAFEKAFGKTPVDVRKGSGSRRWKQNVK